MAALKSNSTTGWQSVFSFTFLQTFKSKAFLITFAILVVLSLVSMPLINWLVSLQSTDTPNPVKMIYIFQETEFAENPFLPNLEDKTLRHILFEHRTENMDALAANIENQETDAVILHITDEPDYLALDFIKSSNSDASKADVEVLMNAVRDQYDIYRMNTLGMSDQQKEILNAAIETKVSLADAEGNIIFKEDTSISYQEYWYFYGILFVTMMVSILASSQVATTIVTEKSTRMVEYLLISVKPLALMIGKVLAMLIAVLIEVLVVICMLLCSNLLSIYFGSSGESVMSRFIPDMVFQNLHPVNIIICLIAAFIGMVFYATLAALSGASISKLEELSEGLMLLSFTAIIGSYIGIGAAIVMMESGVNGFVIFAQLFPLSSAFVLPGMILLGKSSLPLIALAIAMQLLAIILLFRFVAKIYTYLILHNGSPIKLKMLMKLSKTLAKEGEQ